MYEELILFRNELKNRLIPKYKVIGIVIEMLFSKELFSKNSEIEDFLKEVFSLEFKLYLFKSRTLVAARVSKEILYMEKNNQYLKKLYKFIENKIDELKDDTKTKRNQFDGWFSQ